MIVLNVLQQLVQEQLLWEKYLAIRIFVWSVNCRPFLVPTYSLRKEPMWNDYGRTRGTYVLSLFGNYYAKIDM